MSHIPPLIIDLAWIMVVAAFTSIVFKWLKQPVVLGYIVAGYLISNHASFLPNLHDATNIKTWAEIGIIFLLFGLGLEFSFKKLLNVGGASLTSALVIVIGMMFCGFSVGKFLDWNTTDCVFLGGMLSMSSTTIIIKAFKDLGKNGQKFTSVVFGVLVVEDLFAIILMVVLSSLYVGQQVEGATLVWSVFKLVFFLMVWFLVGIYLIPTFIKKAKRFLSSETLLIVSLGLCLGMVVLADFAGFSAALGAFVMGSILAETVEVKAIEKVTQPVRDLFGAVFFVSVGLLVDPNIIVEYWLPILVITLVVIVGQITFSSLGILLSGQTLKVAIQSGFSLAQIGEFAFIIATLGLSLGVTSDFLYPIAVAVSVITTFTTPFIMKMSDPAYRKLDKRMPHRLKAIIERYSSGTVTAATKSDWRLLLNAHLKNMILFSILLCGTVWLLSYYAIPFVIINLPNHIGELIAVTGSLLIISPLIWAITAKSITPKLFVKLWTNSHFNRGLLISLMLLRGFIAVFFCMILLINVYSWKWGVSIGIGLIIMLPLLFSKRIQRGWSHFETQFQDNLKSNSNTKTISNENTHLHISKIRISPESLYAGKTIKELQLREKFHLTVVKIKRGVNYINIPKSNTQLLPFDEVSAVGTDDDLRNFALLTEFHNEDVNPEVEHPIIMQQFWLEKSPKLVGMTIGNSNIRHEFECLVIGIYRADGTSIAPSSHIIFEKGDTVWFAGEKAKIDRLIEKYK